MRQMLTMIVLLALASGCTAFQSVNLQRAGLRSAGDVAVTAYLDQVGDDKWEAHQTEIADVVQRLTAFMGEGEVAELMHPALIDAVRGLVPDQYKSIGNSLLSVVENTSADVNVTKIGARNVARINAFLNGAATGLRTYQGEHRPLDDPETETSPEAGPAPTPSETTDGDVPEGDMPPDEDTDDDNG